MEIIQYQFFLFKKKWILLLDIGGDDFLRDF